MQCPFCELDKPYVHAGSACPHCGRLIPPPPEPTEPEDTAPAEIEAANDSQEQASESPTNGDTAPEPEPIDEPDADPNESG